MCAEGGADQTLSYADVKERLNLPDEDVVRLLHSLACAKYKILLKEPNTKTIGKADTFHMNVKFTDRLRRIKARAPHQQQFPLRLSVHVHVIVSRACMLACSCNCVTLGTLLICNEELSLHHLKCLACGPGRLRPWLP